MNSEALLRETGGFVRATAAAVACSGIIRQLSRTALKSVQQAAEISVEMALN